MIDNFPLTESQAMETSILILMLKRNFDIFEQVIIFLIIQYRFVPDVVKYKCLNNK